MIEKKNLIRDNTFLNLNFVSIYLHYVFNANWLISIFFKCSYSSLIIFQALDYHTTSYLNNSFFFLRQQSPTIYFFNLFLNHSVVKNLPSSVKDKPFKLLGKTKNSIKEILVYRRWLSILLNIKTFRSFKVTKLISKWNRLKTPILLLLEFSLVNILIRSNIVNSYNEVKFLIKKKLIYINGIVALWYTKLTQNDYISLLTTNYTLFFINTRSKLFKKIFLKYQFKYFKYLKNNKNTLQLKKILLSNILFKFSIPKYLEVDYYSCSIYIIYTNLQFYEFFLPYRLLVSFKIIALYNWKIFF